VQSLEVIKVLGGIGDVMARKLLIFDALAGEWIALCPVQRVSANRPVPCSLAL
jgi:hypothetical protein